MIRRLLSSEINRLPFPSTIIRYGSLLVSKDNMAPDIRPNATLSIKIYQRFHAVSQPPIPEPGNIHGIALPHCASVMPNQPESTGSHSRKMHYAEIPVLFYLIIPNRHAGRHKPLLRTFTGTMQNCLHRGASSHEMGFCHPLPCTRGTDG